MQPFLEESARLRGEVVAFKEKLKALKKTTADKAELEALEQNIRETEKSARDAQAKADAIDAAVFDLKAVNPNVVTKLDQRTPEEIIGNIQEQGKIVESALNKLKAHLSAGFAEA
jgi:type I restriction enzyme M protein